MGHSREFSQIRISNSPAVYKHSFAISPRDAPELCVQLSPK